MNARSSRSLAAFAAVSLVFAACSADTEVRDGDTAQAPAAVATSDVGLALAERLGVLNARESMPGLLTAGQPTEEQLDALVEAGYEHVISLRPVDESGAGWEEVHATEHGYDFRRLPISGAASLTRENVEAFAAMLQDTGDEPTVLYCASSNRVGAMMALKAYWLDGVEPQEALELGVANGMTGLTGPVSELLGL
jgi:protein tyrosine phosphatase (PTP) superfamily phosphohydrolase (DUF442 family)